MNAYWLSAGIGANTALYAAFAALALIVLLPLFWLFIASRRRARAKTIRKDNHRISVRNITKIDERRQLVLIRRDNTEHLLLTGGDSDLLIESFPDANGAAAHAAKIAPLFAASETDSPHKAENSAAALNRRGENAYTAKPQPMPAASGENAVNAAPGRAPVPSYTPAARQAQAALKPQQAAQEPAGDRSGAGAHHGNSEQRRDNANAAPAQRRPQPAEDMLAQRRNPAEKRPPIAEEAGFANMRAAEPHNAQTGPAEANISPARPQAAAAPLREEMSAANRHSGARPHNAYTPQAAAPRPADENSAARDEIAAQRNLHSSPDAQRPQEHEMQPRPAAGGVYAPYLGYMPETMLHKGQNARPAQPQFPRPAAPAHHAPIAADTAPNNLANSAYAGARNGSEHLNGGARREMPAAAQISSIRDGHSAAPRPAARQTENGAYAPSEPRGNERNMEARRAGLADNNVRDSRQDNIAPQNGQQPNHGEQNVFRAYERQREQHLAENGRPAARASAFNPLPDTAEAGSRSRQDNGFGLNPQNNGARSEPHNGNGFARVSPPDDDDFDKILQDELLRAPGAIRFPVSQKK